MKLVIATPLYPPEPGGPATYAKVFEEELPQKGWQVEVVKFRDVRKLPKIRRHFAYMRMVYRAAKHADAVLALDPVSVGLPSMIAARLARKPFFVRIPGDYAWEQGTQRYGVTESLDDFVGHCAISSSVRMLQRIERRVALAAKRIIVPSEYLKRIVTAWNVPAKKISVVYNAGPQVQKNHAPAKAEPYIITIARLVPWKGIADVIRTLSLLRASNVPHEMHSEPIPELPELRYVIVGDGPERVTLEALAHDLNVGDAVHFTGALPHDEALAFLHSAAAFVLPTRYEGLSHTILEAFIAKVPVITTPIGGNPELVEDGKTGLMTPIGNTEELARAIGRVLKDHELKIRIVSAAHEKAMSFTRERMVEDTMKVLHG